jgi:hypothetical protein
LTEKKNNRRRFWFIAYWAIVACLVLPLMTLYMCGWMLFKSTQENEKVQANVEDTQQKNARKNFLRYLEGHQEQLYAAKDASAPSYCELQSLAVKINSDLLVMLGARQDGRRDVMITCKPSNSQATSQCILLVEAARSLNRLTLGLGPHPPDKEFKVKGYSYSKSNDNRRWRSTDPAKMSYLLTNTPQGLLLTLYGKEVSEQKEWLQTFRDFADGYLPSEKFLDEYLGEYLRAQIKQVEVLDTTAKGFDRAISCKSQQDMIEAVAAASHSPVVLPVVSDATFVIYPDITDRVRLNHRTQWYRDMCDDSYYLQQQRKSEL